MFANIWGLLHVESTLNGVWDVWLYLRHVPCWIKPKECFSWLAIFEARCMLIQPRNGVSDVWQYLRHVPCWINLERCFNVWQYLRPGACWINLNRFQMFGNIWVTLHVESTLILHVQSTLIGILFGNIWGVSHVEPTLNGVENV